MSEWRGSSPARPRRPCVTRRPRPPRTSSSPCAWARLWSTPTSRCVGHPNEPAGILGSRLKRVPERTHFILAEILVLFAWCITYKESLLLITQRVIYVLRRALYVYYACDESLKRSALYAKSPYFEVLCTQRDLIVRSGLRDIYATSPFILFPHTAWVALIFLVAEQSRRYGMAPAHMYPRKWLLTTRPSCCCIVYLLRG